MFPKNGEFNMKKYLFITMISLHSLAITFSEWKALSKDQKIDYLASNNSDLRYSITGQKIVESRMDKERRAALSPKFKAHFIKLNEYQSDLNTEVEDYNYGKVGPLEITAGLFYSEDNKLLGADFHFFQGGCSHQDAKGEFEENGEYYNNIKEAKLHNCFDNDVSWSGFSYMDYNFKELEHSEYMEWSGH